MSASIWARPAAVRRPPSPWRLPALLMLFGIALALSGCATPPSLEAHGGDPSNAEAKVSTTGYRPVIEAYRSRRPVAPADWRGSNDRVAPAPKKDAR